MKTIAIPILAVVLSFNLSCQKEDEMVTKTINVTLAPGETYSTNLVSHGKEDFSITLQAEHASLSELGKAAHNGNRTYTYTASTEYNGSDQVQITGEQSHGNCPMSNENDQTTVYVYKITVSGEVH